MFVGSETYVGRRREEEEREGEAERRQWSINRREGRKRSVGGDVVRGMDLKGR